MEMVETSDTCKEHCMVKSEVADLKFAVPRMTPLWAFLLLVTLVVSGLGLQWATYKSVMDLTTKMAVFEQRIQTIERVTCGGKQ